MVLILEIGFQAVHQRKKNKKKKKKKKQPSKLGQMGRMKHEGFWHFSSS